MEKQIQVWLTPTATMRMAVGADAQWQLETLRALDTTADATLRAFKAGQDGTRDTLQATAEQALDDLKDALAHVFPA